MEKAIEFMERRKNIQEEAEIELRKV